MNVDFSLLQKRSNKIATSLALSENEAGDVLSELWILATEHPLFYEMSDKELRSIIAKRLHLAARFSEIGEGESSVTDEGDECPSLLEIQTDNVTAETMLVEEEDPDRFTEEEFDMLEKYNADQLNIILSHMSGIEEEIFFLRYILKYKFQEISSMLAMPLGSLSKYTYQERTIATMRVFEDGMIIPMGDYFQ